MKRLIRAESALALAAESRPAVRRRARPSRKPDPRFHQDHPGAGPTVTKTVKHSVMATGTVQHPTGAAHPDYGWQTHAPCVLTSSGQARHG